MINFFKYLLIVICLVSLTTCKKKTSIKVMVFNPALNEYVANAKVALVERKGEGSLFGDVSCEEIASATTNNNGECFFEKEKLRSTNKYQYFCAVTNSWGIQQAYSCVGKSSNFLLKGREQDWLVTDYGEGYLQVQYNNLLNPSQPNDSLIVSIFTAEYYDPILGHSQGGGSVFGAFPFHDINNPPNNPAVITLNSIKTLSGRKVAKIRKRKFGNVTTSIDTIKIYPNQTKVFQINW